MSGLPAARKTDPVYHHSGGDIIQGSPNVFIGPGALPAARVTDKVRHGRGTCEIIEGEPTVLINGLPAARVTDAVSCDGSIAQGCTSVTIGKNRGLSVADAQKLFDKLAKDKNIPFDYPLDCCFARAHEMCRLLIAEGVECNKTWYYSSGWPPEGSTKSAPANLSVSGLPRTGVIPSGSLTWTYHVAPTVVVDGQPMVFDPSLFNDPVTLDEWHSKMVNIAPQLGNPIIKNTDATPFFVDPYGNTVEDTDYSKTSAKFEAHKLARDAAMAGSPD